MRIAIITTVHPATDVRIFHKEALSFVHHGHSVTLIAPTPSRTASQAAIRDAGIEFVELGGSDRLRIMRLQRLCILAWTLFRNRRAFDAWHFHDPECLPVAVALRTLVAKEVLLCYDAHEDLAATILSKAWIPKHLRKVISKTSRKAERWMADRCQLVVVATSGIQKSLGLKHVSTVLVRNYPYVSAPAPRRTRSSSEPLKCIYVGQISTIRGLTDMLSAFSRLEGIATLTLAGNLSPDSLSLEIDEYKASNLNYVGQLEWTEVAPLLRTHDVGLVCLWPEPNYVNSLPTKLFEYLSAGLPVIASDFAAWAEFSSIPGVGIQIDPTDPLRLAQAVQELASNTRLLEEMSDKATDLANHRFSWEAEANKLMEAYEQIRTG